MQASQKPVVVTVIITAIILLVVGAFGYTNIQNNIPTAAEVAALVTVPSVNVPTAAEIASELNIDSSNSKTDDLWEIMFGGCTHNLENNAESDVLNEIDMDELKDFIEDSIDDFDEFVGSLSLDTDETEVTVTELGQCVIYGTEFGEDDDDKAAEVTLVYDFTYEDDSDDTNHKGSVTVTGKVVYEEGDFSEEDVELSYALN